MKIYCKYDKLESLYNLKAHPKNPNKHSTDQVKRLAELYNYHGIRHPVIVSNLSGFVVAGHGRIEAAKQAGLKEFPVVYQDFVDSDAEYAFMVSDNAISDWSELDMGMINADLPDLGPDFDIDMLGIEDFTLDMADKEGLTDEDEVPEAPPEPVSKLGDLWLLGNHRLLCGDSTSEADVSRLMNGEFIDLVYTDPPYGINEEGDRSNRGGLTNGNNLKSFKDDTIDYAVEAYKIMVNKDIKRQVWWGANYYCHSLPQSNNWFVWDKRVEDKQKDTQSDCELAWVKSKWSSVRIFRHLWKGLIKGSEHGQKRVHPTQKPVALAEWSFDYFRDVKSVIDLFGGSGSTLIACEKTNRTCFMMEFEGHYIDVIIKRWEQFTGQKARHESGKSFEEIKAERG